MTTEQDPYKNPYTQDVIAPEKWSDMTTSDLNEQLTILKQRAWAAVSSGHPSLAAPINKAINHIEQMLSQRTLL